MTPFGVFVRALTRTLAICIGVSIAVLNPTLEWKSPSTASVTARRSPADAALDGLREALVDPDLRVRRRAASALQELAAVDAGKGVVGNPDVSSQRSAADAELLTSLESDDRLIRARAACTIQKQRKGSTALIPALIRILADAAPIDPEICGGRWGYRATTVTPGDIAAAALVTLGREAAPALRPVLGSSSAHARAHAAWALGALDDALAVEALSQALSDPDTRVRAQAAWALGAIGDTAAIPGLLRGAADASADVKAQVAWALGAIGDAAGVDGLLELIRDDSAAVRAQAAWALGAIGDRRASESLIAAMKDESVSVRRQATWALGALRR